MTRNALVLILLMASVACGSAQHAPLSAAPPSPATEPSGAMPDSIRWTRSAVEYRAALWQVYRLATARIEAEARTRAAGTWAVILDADETVISNLTQQIEQQGKKYDEAAWAAWVKRREATALPGAKAFLAKVRELGGKIAIVTNRREPVCPDTKAVFATLGLVYDAMLCRTDAADKNPRFDAVAKGTPPSTLPPLAVVAFVGDNITDFPALSQAIKGQDSAFADFGTRFFVLPNPMYGSWERRP
jgi:5'-nucleotidase (lipoprotein e(P4) family)